MYTGFRFTLEQSLSLALTIFRPIQREVWHALGTAHENPVLLKVTTVKPVAAQRNPVPEKQALETHVISRPPLCAFPCSRNSGKSSIRAWS